MGFLILFILPLMTLGFPLFLWLLWLCPMMVARASTGKETSDGKARKQALVPKWFAHEYGMLILIWAAWGFFQPVIAYLFFLPSQSSDSSNISLLGDMFYRTGIFSQYGLGALFASTIGVQFASTLHQNRRETQLAPASAANPPAFWKCFTLRAFLCVLFGSLPFITTMLLASHKLSDPGRFFPGYVPDARSLWAPDMNMLFAYDDCREALRYFVPILATLFASALLLKSILRSRLLVAVLQLGFFIIVIVAGFFLVGSIETTVSPPNVMTSTDNNWIWFKFNTVAASLTVMCAALAWWLVSTRVQPLSFIAICKRMLGKHIPSTSS